MGKTKEQLEMSWTNLKWLYPTENIEGFARKVRQLANVLGKSQEDQVLEVENVLTKYGPIQDDIDLHNC